MGISNRATTAGQIKSIPRGGGLRIILAGNDLFDCFAANAAILAQLMIEPAHKVSSPAHD